MRDRNSVAVLVLGVSLFSACKKSPDSGAVATRQQSNLGVSPATWPQEGPSPIGAMNPVSLLSDVTGAVHRLAVAPTSPSTVYAGSANGGIWKTTNANSVFGSDGGAPMRPHWDNHTDGLPSLTIGALAMDPSNAQHLVAGTGQRSNGLPPGAEGLVYATSDGGTNWAAFDVVLLRGKPIRGITVRGQLLLAAAVDPANGQGLLFRSTNGGAAWTTVNGTGNLPATFGASIDLVSDPSNSDRYYLLAASGAIGNGGVYMGTALGTTWTRVSDTDASPQGISAMLKSSGIHSGRVAVGPTGALAVTVVALGQPVYVGYTLDQGAHWTAMDIPSLPFEPNSDAPAAPKPIAQISRGAVPGGQPTTILVDAGGPTGLKGEFLKGNFRVRISEVPVQAGFADVNGDWLAVPYSPPSDGGTTPSTTQFLLFSRLTRTDGDGTTAPFSISGQGKWQCWLGTNNGNQGETNIALAVDPTNPKFVYMGGDASPIHLVRGDSSQAVSVAIPSLQWKTLSTQGDVHSDIRDMVLDPSGQFLYMSEDGGVFVRTAPRDDAGKWYSIAGDLMTVELRSIALDPLSHAIMGGAQDNGTPSELQPSNGTPVPWTEVEFADGVGVAAVDAHTTDPTTGRPISYRYSSFQGSNDFELHIFDNTGAQLSITYLIHPDPTQTSHLVVSGGASDGGAVVKHLNDVENFDWVSTIGVNRVYNPLANPQPNPQRWLLIPGHNQGVWESRDLGETVTLVPGSPTNGRSFSYGHPTNVEALWVTAENWIPASNVFQTTVYSRLAAGATLTLESTFTSSGLGATAVAMSTADPALAYFTTDRRVFQMSHGGTPVDVTGDLSYLTNGPAVGPGVLRSVVYVPSATNGDRVIVGAAEYGVPGVFMMAVANPGVWTRLGTNLPNVNAMALDYDPANQMLVVGTGGRGAWSLTGVTSLDRAPKALCKDVTVSAGSTCRATSTAAAFNNGSVDPEGNPIAVSAVDPVTLATTTVGPYALGSFPVTIKVADNQGAAALCRQQFSVIDTTPPTLQVPAAKTVSTCADRVAVSVGQATASDNCATALLPTAQVIAKNGVTLVPPLAVTNGQVTLAPGTYTVQWKVSDGSTAPVTGNQTVTVSAAIEVSQTFLLDDRAQLKSASGGFAALLNAGTGTTRVGQDCRTAGITSRAAVTIQHRAIVSGNVVSGSTVTKDSDATVSGTTTQNAAVTLPALPALPTFPAATLGGFTVNAGTTVTKAPGSYSSAIIINGGTLLLQSGTYYFQSLTINSGAILRATATTKVFVRDTMIFNAPFLASSGSAVQPIYLGFAGTALNIFCAFNGTLLAPNASVVLGTGAGITYTGSFFGRAFELSAGSALVCSL